MPVTKHSSGSQVSMPLSSVVQVCTQVSNWQTSEEAVSRTLAAFVAAYAAVEAPAR